MPDNDTAVIVKAALDVQIEEGDTVGPNGKDHFVSNGEDVKSVQNCATSYNNYMKNDMSDSLQSEMEVLKKENDYLKGKCANLNEIVAHMKQVHSELFKEKEDICVINNSLNSEILEIKMAMQSKMQEVARLEDEVKSLIKAKVDMEEKAVQTDVKICPDSNFIVKNVPTTVVMEEAQESVEFTTSSNILKTLAEISQSVIKNDHNERKRRPEENSIEISSKIANTNSTAHDNGTQDPASIQGVKYYSYQNDSNDSCFLLQAKAPQNNDPLTTKQCGPFRLGNLDLTMNEVNGEIQVYGKKVSL